MNYILNLSIEEMTNMNTTCTCGKNHKVEINNIIVTKDNWNNIDKLIKNAKYHKVFIIEDINTYNAAGKVVEEELKNRTNVEKYIFNDEHLIADEKALGQLIVNIDTHVDLLLAIGSGTINDITRFISFKLNIPYSIVCTSPSMDGYASVVSPLIINGIKSTYNAVYPKGIFVNLEILKNSPKHMINAGIGDVLGKYSALSDWKISHLLFNEYYCETIVSIVKKAVDKCVSSCEKLNDRDDNSIENLIQALILTGICIGMAESSRPASGNEHHLSHFWEMKAIENGTYGKYLHGNAVGVATVVIMEVYKYLKLINIDELRNKKVYLNFTEEMWMKNITNAFEDKSKSILNSKKNSISFDKDKREIHFKNIYDNWNDIIDISNQILNNSDVVSNLLKKNNAPVSPVEVGLSRDIFYKSIIGAKDIRDRYGVLQLLEDIGMLNDAAEYITNIFYN